jgi:divalent metal cation (Fe/Co/Zn/Cd) transporter
VRGFLSSLFRPHSHDAADSVDAALESSEQGIRAVKISLVALGVTALAQAVVVVVTGSVALLADTIHNFSDALTAIPLWIAFVIGRRPATRRFTYGYGRAEDLAGVFIVAMIALSAVVAGYESVRRLFDPREIDHVGVVIAAGLIGFAGNELVAVYRIRVGPRDRLGALVADGLHARTDGFTSLAVVAGALGVWPAGTPPTRSSGCSSRWRSCSCCAAPRPTSTAGSWTPSEPELVDAAEASLRATPGVLDVDELRLRWFGHRIRAEVGWS